VSTESIAPRLFFSYSHDNETHKAWVLALANRMVANGVDVILDRWNLSLGSDLGHFMESGLSEADRILAVCSTPYVQKANGGFGGVGYEKMILTSQLMENLQSTRILPIIRENPEGKLPLFLAGRIYSDFREDAQYEAKYAELIREMHGHRVIPRPALGPNPFTGDASPVLAFSRERYVSPSLSGRVVFDYSNNDGSYIVGSGDLAFETKWSRGGTTSIHAYRFGSMSSVALAVGVKELEDLQDVSLFDDSSRVRTPSLGEIVVWRNQRGYYLATKIESVSIRYRDEWRDEVAFTYRIQPDRTPVFSGHSTSPPR
jgi:TIR domain